MKRRNSQKMVVAVVFLVLAVLACGPAADGGAPSITITSPASGTAVMVGEEVQIVSTAAADAGVARVELSINGQVVRTDAPPSGTPATFSVSQPWTPVAEGEVTVSVVAYDTEGTASEPVAITLRVEAVVAEVTPTPVPDEEGEGGCTLNAAYAADVTVPDDTEMSPGETFVKTWRIRNSGTCDWGPGFTLVFVGGDQMGGPASVPVPATAAGSTVDVSVNMAAPSSYGTYRGNWRVQSDTGTVFGSSVYVRIVVPEPATAMPTPTEEPTEEPTPTEEPEPQTIDIVADADAFWWPDHLACMPPACPDFSHGPELQLLNMVLGSPPFQILDSGKIAVHFDLGGIPAGATIEEVTLHLYLNNAEGTGSVSISTRGITSPWSEDDHTVDPSCNGTAGLSRNVGSGSGWYDWDVTAIVQQQYANPSTNYGICLRGGAADDQRFFRSREGSASSRPYIRVTYSP